MKTDTSAIVAREDGDLSEKDILERLNEGVEVCDEMIRQTRTAMMEDFFKPDICDEGAHENELPGFSAAWAKWYRGDMDGITRSGGMVRPIPDPYQRLHDVLMEAYEQAANGKGRERHASGDPFEQQTICQTIRAHGIGFGTGQAEKKGRESHKLLTMENGRDRAVAELLGAINYLAAAIVVIREGK